MYGYIRPLRGELKVREFEAYRSCYCGLCGALGRLCGPISRMVLQYDFVFLAMLLWEPGCTPERCQKRCAAHPCRKHTEVLGSPELDAAAACSVILAWWKLCDNVRDEGFGKSLAARGAKLCLRRAYGRAKKRYPQFDACVKAHMETMLQLEREGEASLDRMADAFAKILASCAELTGGRDTRALGQLLYHVGRWIYIIDALDDLEEDAKHRRYNAVDRRFDLCGAKPGADVLSYLELTLEKSQELACGAYELMEPNHWQPILRNILYLGMTHVSRQVREGTFRSQRNGTGEMK